MLDSPRTSVLHRARPSCSATRTTQLRDAPASKVRPSGGMRVSGAALLARCSQLRPSSCSLTNSRLRAHAYISLPPLPALIAKLRKLRASPVWALTSLSTDATHSPRWTCGRTPGRPTKAVYVDRACASQHIGDSWQTFGASANRAFASHNDDDQVRGAHRSPRRERFER